jgi:hypothetical protein
LGARWFSVDVVWAVAVGILVGALLGTLVGRVVVHLRRTYQEAVGLDNFLALGLIGLSYGLALLAGGYGFLAVFAAGVALRRVERQETRGARQDLRAPIPRCRCIAAVDPQARFHGARGARPTSKSNASAGWSRCCHWHAACLSTGRK